MATYIHRPAPGYLGLYSGDKLLTYGIPDAEFWAWCEKNAYTDLMEHENPERMARVRKNGVGVLHSMVHEDFTLGELVSKRPAEVDPTTKERPTLIAQAVEEPIERER